MDPKIGKLAELTVEAFLIAWLGYLTIYQNYLLYRWHRGLPLPSRVPFVVLGLAMGLAFFWYEWDKFEKSNHSKPGRGSAEPGETRTDT
ncbi:hypothetical protein [Thermococcus sp.]|uniref:hypothetical protein n=1 Tax=Thermococcus sp. TaxID=35749 RepID=UPI0026065C6B|nr:hypothetical protein [Thermococcus sp.]